MVNKTNSQAAIRKLEWDDIQLLRFWRNSDSIRSNMIMTDQIERCTQRKWFKNLDKKRVSYFIYSLGARDVGCVNLTNINIEKKTFEGGIFCGDLNYHGHWINVWACIQLYNYAFHDLKLDMSYATILMTNRSALSLNKSLGYELIAQNDNVGRFVLDRSKYTSNAERLARYLARFVLQPV